MRYLATWVFLILFVQIHSINASSQTVTANERDIVEIGNGLFIETIPAKFATMISDDPGPLSEPEWVIIPAVYETINETFIVQEAYVDLKILPPTYDLDGSLTKPATAVLQEIPAITKQITRRVVKTPSRAVKRVIPNMYNPPTIRKKIKEKVYILKDKRGVELQRYEDPAKLARYINSQ